MGSGIGLAVVAEIMESHKGRLIIDSELGKGTSVTVRLPLET
ncbi:MAG: ATP-binding protein [Oscillospiraceae bacterium]